MKIVVSPTDRPHETFETEINYYEDKKQQLITEMVNLIAISSEKMHPKIIKTYIELAFGFGKIKGMDTVFRKWEKADEKIYGK